MNELMKEWVDRQGKRRGQHGRETGGIERSSWGLCSRVRLEVGGQVKGILNQLR